MALALVSGRGLCPVEMINAVAFQGWPTNVNYWLLNVYGSETDQGRIDAVKQTKEKGAKYLWFVDDDTVPPENAGRLLLDVLMKHGPPNGNVMVAAGVYTTRRSNPEPLVYMEQGAGPSWDWKCGDVFKCWGAGTGCMMIDLSLFENLPEPWFMNVQESQERWSDDLYFCDLVNQSGFGVMAHGGVLCHHYDLENGIIYQLPRGSFPYQNQVGPVYEPRMAQALLLSQNNYDLVPNPWMTQAETVWLIEQAKRSRYFAEVGCWKGVTTRNIAKNARDTRVIAVDHFRGSKEQRSAGYKLYEPKLKEEGWLLREFQGNVQNLDNVELVLGQSQDVTGKWIDGYFDTVFIDASHEYAHVKRDIELWQPLVRQGGILCGHDRDWPDVEAAVKEMLPSAINIPGTTIWMARIGANNG